MSRQLARSAPGERVLVKQFGVPAAEKKMILRSYDATAAAAFVKRTAGLAAPGVARGRGDIAGG